MGDLLTEDSTYPTELDTHTRAADLLDTIVAEHINAPATAIVNIETELGLGLKGIMVDLAHRLATNMETDGGILRYASAPLAPPHIPHFYYNTVSNTVFVYNISTASYDAVSTAVILASYIRSDLASTITVAHTFDPTVAGAPFILGANATGQLVIGLNADTVDSRHAGIASGVATLNGSIKVVEDPANAQTTFGVGKIPVGIAGTGTIDPSWIRLGGATDTLGSTYSIPADTTWYATGLYASCSPAGHFHLSFNVRTQLLTTFGPGYIYGKIKNTTAGTYVTNSERVLGHVDSAGTIWDATAILSMIVTAAAGTTFELYVSRSAATWVLSNIMSDGDGRSSVTTIQMNVT